MLESNKEGVAPVVPVAVVAVEPKLNPLLPDARENFNSYCIMSVERTEINDL